MSCDGRIGSNKVIYTFVCYDCGEELGSVVMDVSDHFDHGQEWCEEPCVRYYLDIDGVVY